MFRYYGSDAAKSVTPSLYAAVNVDPHLSTLNGNSLYDIVRIGEITGYMKYM